MCTDEFNSQKYYFDPIDHSLNLRNIDAILENVRGLDWNTLGLKLGLREVRLERIQNDFTGHDQRRQEMIKEWLEYDWNPTWSKLADALEKMGKNGAAAKIRRKFN